MSAAIRSMPSLGQREECQQAMIPRAAILRDISSARWLYVKGALFLLIGLIASFLIVLEHPTLRVGLLLVVAIWGFCRAYYFAFYVIEHYVDRRFRFSGLVAFVRYALRQERFTK